MGEPLQACAVRVGPVEVGAALTLATEEHPVAFGRELWTISAVHLPGCDLARILWRACVRQSRLWTNTAVWSSSRRVRSKTSIVPSGENAGAESSNSNAPRFWTLVTWWESLPSSHATQIPLLCLKASVFPSGEKAGSEPFHAPPPPGVHRLFWC